MSIIEDFNNIASVFGNKVAIRDGDNTCTYAALAKYTDKLAEIILNQYGKNQPIIILLEPSIDQIITIIAVMKACCYYIPCDTRLPLQRIAYLIDDSNAHGIITNSAHLKHLSIENFINLDECDLNSNSSEQLPLPQQTDLAYIIYTSGSTGLPKGVKISHGNLESLFTHTKPLFSFNETDIWAYLHSYSFDFSVWELWGALLNGASIDIFSHTQNYNSDNLAQQIIAKKITVLNQTPSSFNRIQNTLFNALLQDKLSLRYIIFGGEKLDVSHLSDWLTNEDKNNIPTLVNMYGITELTIHCTFSLVREAFEQFGYQSIIGKLLGGLSYHLLPIPEEDCYELLLSGETVCQGYLNRPELNAEKFIKIDNKNYFKTGDLVRLHQHQFEYIGRIDFQIKLRGYRIELGEINYHLKNYPHVDGVATFPTSTENQPQLISFLTVSDDFQYHHIFENNQVNHWKEIYETLYSKQQDSTDATFNITGWMNSYTQAPFSSFEMREWLDDTLVKIKSLKPKRILEIGCGSGLILFNLLDSIEEYCGLDISTTMIEKLRDKLQNHKDQNKVTLFATDAINIDKLPLATKSNHYDCIIFNSIIQYFPSTSYLKASIVKLTPLLTSNASLFFGDIRNFAWISEYHYSLMQYKHGENFSQTTLQTKILTSIQQEQELLISPEFFARHIQPLFAKSQLFALRKGASQPNELNQFRYDLILQINPDMLQPKPQLALYPNSPQALMFQLQAGLSQGASHFCVKDISDPALQQYHEKYMTLVETNDLVETKLIQLSLSELQSVANQLEMNLTLQMSDTHRLKFDAYFYHGDYCLFQPYLSHTIDQCINFRNRPVDYSLEDLMNHLKAVLPSYMVPSYCYIVDQLPLNHNGKIAKTSLMQFHQDHIAIAETNAIEDHESNQQESLQNILISLWKKTLKLNQVDIHDDFFESGGDSITCLQFISQCKRRHININIQDLFRYRSIHQLLSIATIATEQATQQPLPSEPFDLSPIQNWFFSSHQGQHHQYCQTMLFTLKDNVEVISLSNTINTILQTLSIFKLRFVSINHQWKQCYRNELDILKINDRGILSSPKEIDRLILNTIESINCFSGHIACLDYFTLANNTMMALTIHHGMMDAVSWMNLITEILAYEITPSHQTATLSEKHSYHEYIKAIEEIPTSLLLEDLNFWLVQKSERFFNAPDLSNQSSFQQNQIQLEIMPVACSSLTTFDLLTLQLTALGKALRQIKNQSVTIHLEKHGREPCLDIDLSQSIGWYTAIFPLKLDLTHPDNPLESIRYIETLLSSIPHGGVTFSIAEAQHLLPMTTSSPIDILFNFWGNIDNLHHDNTLFKAVSPYINSINQLDLSGPTFLQINSYIKDNQLHVYFIYDDNIQHYLTDIIKNFHKHFIDLCQIKNKDLMAVAPLTELQQAYTIGTKNTFTLGNIFPNMYMEIESAELNLLKLETAWNQLLKRHDMLRVILADTTQSIRPYQPYTIVHHTINREELGNHLYQMRERFTDYNFSSHQQHYLIEVTQVKNMTTMIHFLFDIRMMDMLSVNILLEEWATLYQNIHQPLPSLHSSFFNYLKHLETYKQSSEYEKDMTYWLTLITTLPPAPNLPVPAHHSQPLKMIRKTAFLNESILRQLKKITLSYKTTPSVILLALYGIALDIWSQQGNMTINVMLDYRHKVSEDIDHLIGPFNNTILVPIELQKHASSFESLLNAIQTNLWDAIAHSRVNGTIVIREYNKFHQIYSRASMPVVFSSSFSNDNALNALGQLNYTHLQTPFVSIDNHVSNFNDQLRIDWDFLENYFYEGFIEVAFNTYLQLIELVANNVEEFVQSYPTLPLCHTVDDGVSDSFLYSAFLNNARNKPEHIAILQGSLKITYAELLQNAMRAQDALRSFHLKTNACVAIILPKGYQQISATLGTMMAGYTYLPIDPDQPIARINSILKIAEAEAIVTSIEYQSLINTTPISNVLWIDSISTKYKRHNIPKDEKTVHQPAYIIFTSGTTGEPKGVMISHAAAWNTIVDINEKINLHENDKLLAVSNLTFDLSIYDMFGPLSVGACIVIPEQAQFDPASIANDMFNHAITVWNSVPLLLKLLLQYLVNNHQNALPSLNKILLSGDVVQPHLIQQIKQMTTAEAIYALGGATEAGIWSIYYNCTEEPHYTPTIPYGKALYRQKVTVRNTELQCLPIWAVGEIYIAGESLALAYINNPLETANKFLICPHTQERLYKTGDIGRILPDGNIEFLGRLDNQVKINGNRVELGEIENHILLFSNITSAIVIFDKNKNRLVAFIEMASNQDTIEALLRYLKSQLPEYMIPSIILPVTHFPLTTNGKIDKQALLSKTETVQTENIPALQEMLQEDLIEMICSAWKSILNLSQLDLKLDFYAHGGDSLKAIELFIKLQHIFKKPLSLNMLFAHPTIAGMSKYIQPLRQEQSLILLSHQETANNRIYCIHPIGGRVSCYLALTKHLEGVATIYGLSQIEEYYESLQLMAQQYAEEIINQDPNTTYHLLGWSMGGLLAIEMSLILKKKWNKTVQLTLIDPAYPNTKNVQRILTSELIDEFINLLSAEININSSTMRDSLTKQFLNQDIQSLKIEDNIYQDVDEYIKQQFIRFVRNRNLIHSYQLTKNTAENIQLFLPNEPQFSEKLTRWKECFPSHLHCHTVGKTHFSALYENINEFITYLHESMTPIGIT